MDPTGPSQSQSGGSDDIFAEHSRLAYQRADRFQQALIAAVHGLAIGGGTIILTHCDI